MIIRIIFLLSDLKCSKKNANNHYDVILKTEFCMPWQAGRCTTEAQRVHDRFLCVAAELGAEKRAAREEVNAWFTPPSSSVWSRIQSYAAFIRLGLHGPFVLAVAQRAFDVFGLFAFSLAKQAQREEARHDEGMDAAVSLHVIRTDMISASVADVCTWSVLSCHTCMSIMIMIVL